MIPRVAPRPQKNAAIVFIVLSIGLVFGQQCRGGSVGFEDTGSLATARYQHTATLLLNGKVLVTGGYRNGDLGTAELYDPATGTWSATGIPISERAEHTATLLLDGKVLVVCGWFNASTELYDPVSGTWSSAGNLPSGRRGHTATLLPNGKVLVVGGTFDSFGTYYPLDSAELYDPVSGTWTTTSSLATARYGHTATLLPDGKVLVAGGSNSSYPSTGGGPLASAELYDPASGTWTATGSMVATAVGHTGTLLPDGKVLSVGNADAELYDPVSGIWTSTGSLGAPRYGHTATLLPSGKVLVAAGTADDTGVTASAELYEPATGTWTATGSLSTARTFHSATLLPNGKVLTAAGSNNPGNGAVLASAEIYTGPPTPPSLLNISTRLRIAGGDNAMIGGFIITGIDPKTVIVRGIGPSLGVPGALADPAIDVYDALGVLRASNDNWNDATTRQQIIDSGLAPTNDLESALWGIISPGAYTVVVRGNNGGTGLGLFEVYDLDSAANSKLVNVSTRGLVQTDNDVLIGGFIAGGGTEGGTASVLVRALGPSTSVTGALADPTLELRDGNGMLVDSNDNWKVRSDGSSQQAEVEASTIPPSNDLESAIATTVSAGSYTVIVRGNGGTSGLGLVEVYRF